MSPPASTEAEVVARRTSRPLWIRGAVAFVVLGVVAWVVVSRPGMLDTTRLVEAMRAVGIAPFVVGLAGGLGVAALQALRWWYLARPVVDMRYRDALATVMVGSLINSLLPARAGDVLRVQYLQDRTRASRATILATEVVDFWVDKSGWVPAFALYATMGAPPAWMNKAVLVVGGATAVIVVAHWLFRARMRGVSPTRNDVLARFARGISDLDMRRLAVSGLAFAALPWAWEAAVVVCVGRMSGLPLSVLDGFVLLTVFNLATIVPVPGNLGTFEAASSSLLVSLGIPLERALAFSLVYHASQLLPGIVGGALALLVRRFTQVTPPLAAFAEAPAPPGGQI